MTGLLIATHGNLGQSFLEAATLILGPQAQAGATGIFPGEGKDDFEKKAKAVLQGLATPEGTLILCDICGGSPHQICHLFKETEKVKILFGANLPMVVEFFLSRQQEMTLDALAQKVYEAGVKGIRGAE